MCSYFPWDLAGLPSRHERRETAYSRGEYTVCFACVIGLDAHLLLIQFCFPTTTANLVYAKGHKVACSHSWEGNPCVTVAPVVTS
jgi:hypothetical protein